MGTDVTGTARAVLRPTTPCLPLALGRRLHGLTRHEGPLNLMLTEVECKTLKRLLQEYRVYLNPGTRHEVSALLTRLRSHYFLPVMSEALAKAVAEDWADDLSGFPLWGVKSACDRYRRINGSRAPRPADIIGLAEEEIEGERQQLREIKLALAAQPTDPKPTPATPEQVDEILEKSGVRTMMDEAQAEKPRPKFAEPVHRRAHDAAMEAFNRERAAGGADGR